MSLRARIARLERAADARAGGDLDRHWERVFDERLADLERFLAAVPASYEARVTEHLPRVCAEVFVRGPAIPPEDAPAFVRWAVGRSVRGRGHPFNPPLPDPLPGALLDLFLDHPGAEVWHCPHCQAALPFVPASGQLGVPYRAGMDYVRPRSLASACPVCAVDLHASLTV
ncbi:hypothetical protein J0H58_33105 [bacterium]|nr:hypothetical protein [bacterium]